MSNLASFCRRRRGTVVLAFGSVAGLAYRLRFPEIPGWLLVTLTLGTTVVFSLLLDTWLSAREEISRREGER